MTTGRQTPNELAIIARLERRVAALERKLTAVVDSRRLPALFSFAGPLVDVEDLESPRYRFVWPVKFTLLSVDLNVAGSGDVIIELHRDGVLARTLTVPSGDTFYEDANPLTVPAGSYLTATVTQASAAEDCSIGGIPALLR